jgi:hypothetical protein
MTLPPDLTAEERQLLRDLDQLKLAEERLRMPKLADKLVRPIYGVDGLFNHWRRAVEVLEQHRTYMKQEFMNDLTCRDTLEALVTAVPAPLRAKLRASLDPLDDRYRAASAYDDGVEFGLGPREPPPGWWWLRRPDPPPPGW